MGWRTPLECQCTPNNAPFQSCSIHQSAHKHVLLVSCKVQVMTEVLALNENENFLNLFLAQFHPEPGFHPVMLLADTFWNTFKTFYYTKSQKEYLSILYFSVLFLTCPAVYSPFYRRHHQDALYAELRNGFAVGVTLPDADKTWRDAGLNTALGHVSCFGRYVPSSCLCRERNNTHWCSLVTKVNQIGEDEMCGTAQAWGRWETLA